MADRKMPDCEGGAFYRTCLPQGASWDREGSREEGDHGVMLCKRLEPNVLLIKSGLLFIDENKSRVTPETLSLTCRTKIIFAPEHSTKKVDMKTVFFVSFAALFLAASSLGCNMMRGAGEDISNAGGSIQKTVDRND